MINGRHCKIEDYWRLENKTKEIYSLLDTSNEVDLSNYLDLVRQYDEMIANSIAGKIRNKSNQEIKQIIKTNVDELLKNILTDINEHN